MNRKTILPGITAAVLLTLIAAPQLTSRATAAAMAPATCKPAGHFQCPTPTLTPSWSCVKSGPYDRCGPYTGQLFSDGPDAYVANNCWRTGVCTQTIYANSTSDWQATAVQPAGNTTVQTAPQVEQMYTRPDGTGLPVNSLTSLTSTFTENMGEQPGTSGDASYDMWLSQAPNATYSTENEVMVWNQQVNFAGCTNSPVVTGVMFGGQAWDMCQFSEPPGSPGPGTVWFRPGVTEQSGSVDLLAFLNWMVTNGYLPAGSGLNEIDYGFEVVSTGGQPETFKVTGFTLTGG